MALEISAGANSSRRALYRQEMEDYNRRAAAFKKERRTTARQAIDSLKNEIREAAAEGKRSRVVVVHMRDPFVFLRGEYQLFDPGFCHPRHEFRKEWEKCFRFRLNMRADLHKGRSVTENFCRSLPIAPRMIALWALKEGFQVSVWSADDHRWQTRNREFVHVVDSSTTHLFLEGGSSWLSEGLRIEW